MKRTLYMVIFCILLFLCAAPASGVAEKLTEIAVAYERIVENDKIKSSLGKQLTLLRSASYWRWVLQVMLRKEKPHPNGYKTPLHQPLLRLEEDCL